MTGPIEALQNPETRLGYELLPEVVAEYVLREISPPEKFEYVLRDRSGGVHSFEVAGHPIAPVVHRVIDDGRLTHPALKLLRNSSSYSAAVSGALNGGEALANLSIAVAPIGVRLHRGKLEIIGEN